MHLVRVMLTLHIPNGYIQSTSIISVTIILLWLLFVVCGFAILICCHNCLFSYIVSMSMQVEARSHEVWGNEEGLEREREMRKERREKKKEKKYAKEIKGGWIKCCHGGAI